MNFRMLNGKQCAKNRYRGSYSKDDALRKCYSEESCSGVYDDNCDDKGPFYLCPKLNGDPFAMEESSLNPTSCVHVKEGCKGIKHLIYFRLVDKKMFI